MRRLVPTVLLVSALASAFGGCEPRPGKGPIKPTVGVLAPAAEFRAPHSPWGGPAAHAPSAT